MEAQRPAVLQAGLHRQRHRRGGPLLRGLHAAARRRRRQVPRHRRGAAGRAGGALQGGAGSDGHAHRALHASAVMKQHCFTAREAMGWLRIVRPGSVIGGQQDFLCAREALMHSSSACSSPARASRRPRAAWTAPWRRCSASSTTPSAPTTLASRLPSPPLPAPAAAAATSPRTCPSPRLAAARPAPPALWAARAADAVNAGGEAWRTELPLCRRCLSEFYPHGCKVGCQDVCNA
jgi:hypothetical protein